MAHQYEPRLQEPKYAQDEYYVNLHGKWSQKTAALLNPKGGGGVHGGVAGAGGWSTFQRSNGGGKSIGERVGAEVKKQDLERKQQQQQQDSSSAVNNSSTHDLMASHLQNYQRALSSGTPGGTTTASDVAGSAAGGGTTPAQSLSPVPRPQHYQDPNVKGDISSFPNSAGMRPMAPSRGHAQREEVLSSTPQAVSHSPEMLPTPELFSPMSTEAYAAQRRRVAEKTKQHEGPVSSTGNSFSPRPPPPEDLVAISAQNQEKVDALNEQLQKQGENQNNRKQQEEEHDAQFRRSPPRDKYLAGSGEQFLGSTPILKMQLVQSKLAEIANHKGELSTAEVQGLLADVETILQQQAADAGTPAGAVSLSPLGVQVQPEQQQHPGWGPPRADAASSPIRTKTPPRKSITPPRSPLKVVDSFTQAVPSPHKESSVQTFSHALTNSSANTSPKLPPVTPPIAPPPQPQPQYHSQEAALSQFWTTYAYYAAAYQAYNNSNNHQQQSPALHQHLAAGSAQGRGPSPPGNNTRSASESSGVGWGNSAPVFASSNPRVKHRPQTTSSPPSRRQRSPGTGSRGGTAKPHEQVKGRGETEANGPVREKSAGVQAVDDFFEADRFDPKRNSAADGGWTDHPSPGRSQYDRNNLSHVQQSAPDLRPGENSLTVRGRAASPTLLPKYAQTTAAARSRSEQRAKDREKRAELVRLKAEETQRLERMYLRRERQRDPVLTQETERAYMKKMPRWA